MKRFHFSLTYSLILVFLFVSGMGIYAVFAEIPSPSEQAPEASAPSSYNIIPNFSSILVTDDNQSGVLLDSSGQSGIKTTGTGIAVTTTTNDSIGLQAISFSGTGIFVSDNSSAATYSFDVGIKGVGSGNNGIGIEVPGNNKEPVGIYAKTQSNNSTHFAFKVEGNTKGLAAYGGYGGVFAVSNDTGISVSNSFVKGIYEYTANSETKTAEGILGQYNKTDFGVYTDAPLAWIGGSDKTFSITDNADLGDFAAIIDLDISESFQSGTIDAPGLIAKSAPLNVNGYVDFSSDDETLLYLKTNTTADISGDVSLLSDGLMLLSSPNNTTIIESSSSGEPVTVNDSAKFNGNFYSDGKLTAKTIGSVGIRTCESSSGTQNSVSCLEGESLMSCSAEISNTSGLSLKKVYPETDSNTCTARHSDIPSGGTINLYAYCFSSLGSAPSLTTSTCNG